MSLLRVSLLAFLVLFLLPLAAHAWLWMRGGPSADWSRARWSSAGLLPPPSAKPEAMVHVYAARVGWWRGAVAHHTWVVVKERGAARYSRYDVVGWGNPVRTDGYAPDALWFGNRPELVGAVEGPAAEPLIPRVRAAVEAYRYARAGDYAAWPGPNSNTFTASLLAAIPEAGIALPPTALGKDWRGAFYAGVSPSRTGVQVSLGGVLGVTLAWVEGIEVNLLGTVAGLDLRRPALKLPGFGRLGWPSVQAPGAQAA